MAKRRSRGASKKMPIRSLVSFILVLVVIVISLSAVKIFFTSYPYFNISKVNVVGLKDYSPDTYRSFLGKNIFSLKLM